uniref:Golgin subfamily A member 4 n=1 Tax=Aceria tosichella TaxID=561515 RepID=A0A6G1SQ86_9ACAR
MSEDMSMFKKMKDKITDEVSSATNRLQNIQIIDQLATSIGQQVVKNDSMPHQRLPDLPEHTALPTDSRFSLIDDNPIVDCEEEDELNSEISPQHQLFNERTIRRLKSSSASSDDRRTPKNKNGPSPSAVHWVEYGSQHSVIDVNHLSSDLDDDLDGEIDLLDEKRLPSTSNNVKPDDDMSASDRLITYKARYRDVVHALRRLNDDHRLDRSQLESKTKELTAQISALKEELHNVRQQLLTTNNSAINSDSERKSNSSSPHQSNKQTSKIKDLENLMAKCKESLKAKNAQLKILKNQLNEVDKFREQMDELKSDLKELKNAHETWTLSIAESKRVMHQEIEDKNSEMETIKSQLKECNHRLLQQKSNIQNLESRLVSMSAAHQKERESLIKELTNTKNSAINRLQKQHELQLERVKLDLEKTIESLKAEILIRDEQILRGGQRQQELEKQNLDLKTDLDDYKKRCEDYVGNLDELKTEKEGHAKEIEELKSQINELKNESTDCADLKAKNVALEQHTQELNQQVQDLSDEVSRLKETNEELEQRVNDIKSKTKEEEEEKEKPCSSCHDLRGQLSKEAENHEQALYELHTKLDLMTTANTDQEKALNDLMTERDAALESVKASKLELEELSKKNESLLQVLQDNDSEMQAQQEQLNQIASFKQQLEVLKKENASLSSSLNQIKSELTERNCDLAQAQETINELEKKLTEADQAFKNASADVENLKREKESLLVNLESESKTRRETDQHLIVNILAALKNLETPETSPGSDKNYQAAAAAGDQSISKDGENHLPDPIKLSENLSSLALDRSTAYMTSNQRLQAVLLDNTMISEEVKRLREELNALSQEKAQEIMSSLEEVERLRTENQALIHDQKAYDDQIEILEAEIETLKQKVSEVDSHQCQMVEASTETTDETAKIIEELASKNNEIEQLRKLVAETEANRKSLQMVESADIPSSTEFEYLKNIVYQFLMGREPITLARVISAIFKFDKDQMEQICKIQEAIHQVTS